MLIKEHSVVKNACFVCALPYSFDLRYMKITLVQVKIEVHN